jgi:hypothetical protein
VSPTTVRKVLSHLPPELRVEIEENRARKDLSESEKADAIERVASYLSALFPNGRPAQNRDIATLEDLGFQSVMELAAFLVTADSRNTIYRRKAVLDAAKEDPTLQPLVAEMDRTGNVRRTYTKLQHLRAVKAGKDAGLPATVRLLVKVTEEQANTIRAAVRTVGGDTGTALATICQRYLETVAEAQAC